MPENQPQMFGPVRLAQLRMERETAREQQPGVESSDHPRADVFFLLGVVGLLESTLDLVSAAANPVTICADCQRIIGCNSDCGDLACEHCLCYREGRDG